MKNFNGYKIVKWLSRDKFLILDTFGRHILFMADCDDTFPELDMLIPSAHKYKNNDFGYYTFDEPYNVIHKFKEFKDLETQFPEYLL